ncbi:MAG: GTPase [Candidatus Promineifilaceae bacterium]
MPTNLPPEYHKVEERYKAAIDPAEKLALLEEMISIVPKHKGTDKLRADLRKRLSKMKLASQAKQKASRHVSAYHISREGAGQIAVVGPANVGKSALVTALTNATPEVADHPFTTWTPTPGMIDVGGAQIQLIDTPPLNREYVESAMMDLIRRSDLVILVIDLQGDPLEELEYAVKLLEDHRIGPICFEERYADKPRFRLLPFLVVVNKNDDASTDEDFDILCELLEDDWPLIAISAVTGRNLEKLKETLFDSLGIIRIFSKPPGSEADLTAPFVAKRGTTVEELAGKIHKDFTSQLKSARIWGSVAFQGQLVGRDHVLEDGDVVELKV